MPSEITMPQLSDTMTEGTVVKWLRKEGDKVKSGEMIAEVETDKATMEMEAFDSGTLAVILAGEGQKVGVGKVMGVLAVGKETVEDVKKQYSGSAAAPAAPEKKQEPAAGEKKQEPAAPPSGSAAPAARAPSAGSQNQSAPAPAKQAASAPAVSVARPEARASKTAHEEEEGGGVPGGPLEQGRAQSRYESVREHPDHTSEAISRKASDHVSQARGASGQSPITHFPDGRIRVSPLARRIAQQHNIDLSRVKGSGPGGRIIQRDIENFEDTESEAAREGGAAGEEVAKNAGAGAGGEARSLQPQSVPVLAARAGTGAKEVIPLSKMRGVIAKRLQQSKQNLPHFYETIDIDVEDLSRMRARLNESLKSQNVKLSLGDLIAKAVATALLENPGLNAHFNGTEITRFGDVNLGMAVALPEGLIVPVLRGINHMGFREIRLRSADLVERARAQRLKQDELTGATFTVSNLGMFGVREFSAIINPPEVGILAIGGAEKRAVVKDDQIVARMMMTVTLSADHRAVDGAAAAEFLGTLRQLLEEPGLMLV